MRETDPDKLNLAHRYFFFLNFSKKNYFFIILTFGTEFSSGSVPPILALKNKKRTVIQEILVALILLTPLDVKFLDETIGDSPILDARSQSPSLGYFSGRYVYINKNGVLLEGAGKDLPGLIGAILPLLKENDKITYQFIVGESSIFKPALAESEFIESTCF